MTISGSYNKDYEEKFGKLEIGKIYFTDIRNLSGADVSELETSIFDENADGYKYAPTLTWSESARVTYYLDKLEKVEGYLPILIAVKYIGNGLFEEMITGEILVSSGQDIGIKKTDDSKQSFVKLPDISLESSLLVNYEDYLLECKGEKRITKYGFVQLLLNCIERNKNYPISLSSEYPFYEVNEENKEIYLGYKDEDRKENIEKVKELAISESNDVNKQLLTIISDLSKLKKEDLEMAYLENNLYNFEKRRTK